MGGNSILLLSLYWALLYFAEQVCLNDRYAISTKSVRLCSALIMFYSIGLFVLDSEKEVLLLESSGEVVTSNGRIAQLFLHLVIAYPNAVDKTELTSKLWPDDEVTEWSVPRLVSTVRKLLSAYDSKTEYIKTVHAKGFKLAVAPLASTGFGSNAGSSPEPLLTEPRARSSQLPSDPSAKRMPSRRRLVTRKWLIALSVICSLMAFYYSERTLNNTSPPVYGDISPAQIVKLPITSDWITSKPNTINYTTEGVAINPVSKELLFASKEWKQAAFFQGAEFIVRLSVTKSFVDNEGWVGYYFQTTQDKSWPGEWNCGIYGKELKSLEFDYHCRIDENESFTKVQANELVLFGIKIYQPRSVSSATIRSAEIRLPASISTDQGWHASNNATLQYNRGVSYRPESVTQTLSTIINGPINIKGTKLAFTLAVDKVLKKPDTTLELFMVNRTGKWENCSVPIEKMESVVFTTVCEFKEVNDPFVLAAGEKIEIGLRPYGKIINGEVKIIGITVID